MATLVDTRRYLTDFDAARTGHILTDVLVIGSGVAGSRAAIEAARHGTVTLVTKGQLKESTTRHAQGGIAAALSEDDSPQLHLDDTVSVGCGLCRTPAIRLMVEQAPDRINELLRWGMPLDRDAGEIALTREGGHSLNRIVHAHGDQTGLALTDTLTRRLSLTQNLRVFAQCYVIDLLTVENACVGVIAYHHQHGHQLIWAKQTILAGGGCGQIWRETTNPAIATGDMVAAAFRAGAVLCGMELMQFHPTTLYVAGSGRALISEAVRGEGGHLVNRSGERFMASFHPDAELAPRDIVSRAIHEHLQRTRSNCVYLDVRHLNGFRERFPGIARLCTDFEIDVAVDLIPVRPSAHYMIGGVNVDLGCGSSIDGLLCCGESACSGVHGANRLASNSLLEGLVFGKIAGEVAGSRAAKYKGSVPTHPITSQNAPSSRTPLDLADIRNSLRSVMWRNVGIVRERERLLETCDILDFWAHYTLDKMFDEAQGWELQNQLTVARLVAMSALTRTTSIGVHFRSDSTTEDAKPYELHVERCPKGSVATGTPASA